MYIILKRFKFKFKKVKKIDYTFKRLKHRKMEFFKYFLNILRHFYVRGKKLINTYLSDSGRIHNSGFTHDYVYKNTMYSLYIPEDNLKPDHSIIGAFLVWEYNTIDITEDLDIISGPFYDFHGRDITPQSLCSFLDIDSTDLIKLVILDGNGESLEFESTENIKIYVTKN
jgi:hypothetical protein